LAVNAFANGSSETSPGNWVTVANRDRVMVSGRLHVVGNAMRPSWVITDGEGHDWYIDDTGRDAVAGLDQQEVTVDAVVTRMAMTLADGRKLEDRRVLTKIKIVKNEPALER
jgi:hypothetical protein